MKRGIIILSFILILCIGFSSASFLDSFFDGLTGKATGNSGDYVDIAISKITTNKANYSIGEPVVYNISVVNAGSAKKDYILQLLLTNPTNGQTSSLNPISGSINPGEEQSFLRASILNERGVWKLKSFLEDIDGEDNQDNNVLLKDLIVGPIPDPNSIKDISVKDIRIMENLLSNRVLVFNIDLENRGDTNETYTQHIYLTNPRGSIIYLNPTTYSSIKSGEVKSTQKSEPLIGGDGTWSIRVLLEDIPGDENLTNNEFTKTFVVGNPSNPEEPICGNEIIEEGEVCDGNTNSNGDSCNEACSGFIENPLECPTGFELINGECVEIIPEPICGNEIIEEGEVCDSNSISCSVEGYSGAQSCKDDCSGFNSCSSEYFCGDGVKNGNEVCDDGDLNGEEGKCNNSCSGLVPLSCSLTSASWFSTSAIEGQSVGLEILGENCENKEIKIEIYEDDGALGKDFVTSNPSNVRILNRRANANWVSEWQCDGALAGVCAFGNPEYKFRVSLVEDLTKQITSNNQLIVSELSPTCGNGLVQAGEECDDGNGNDLDSCSNSCTNNFCGDGVVNNGEVCDSNQRACNLNGYSGSEVCNEECSSFDSCTTGEFCGDNIINGLEVCDGNTDSDGNLCNEQCSGFIIPEPIECPEGFVLVGNECQIIEPIGDLNPELVGKVIDFGQSKGVKVLDNIAYISSNDFGLTTVDITDINNPILLGSSDKTFSGGNSIDFENGKVIIGNREFVGEIYYLDVSNLEDPSLIKIFEREDGVGYSYPTFGDNGYIYAKALIPVPEGISYGEIAILSTNPNNPSRVLFNMGTVSVASVGVSNGYLYALVSSSNNPNSPFYLKVFDISNPTNPREVKSVATGLTTISDFEVDGNAAVILSYGSFVTFDLSNPTNPIKKKVVSLSRSFSSVSLEEGFVYLGHGTYFERYDIRNLNSPVLIESISTSSSFFDIGSFGELVVLPIQDSGIQIIDFSKNPTYISFFPVNFLETASSIKVKGQRAFVQGNSQVKIVDISNPYSLRLVGTISPLEERGAIRGYEVVGDYVYMKLLSTPNDGLSIYDVSNPNNPRLVLEGEKSINLNNPLVVGNYLYFGSGNNLGVVDVSNPSSPRLIKNVAATAYPQQISYSGTILATATLSGVDIFDISSPSNPVFLSNVPGSSKYISIDGNKIYSSSSSQIKIIDISNPSSPRIENTFSSVSEQAIAVKDNVLVLAKPEGAGGLFGEVYFYDMSNPKNPIFVDKLITIGKARSVMIEDGYAYVSSESSLVNVIKLFK